MVLIYHHPAIAENEIRRKIQDFSYINSIICPPKATREFINLIKKIAKDYSIPDSLVKESEIKQNRREIFEIYIESVNSNGVLPCEKP